MEHDRLGFDHIGLLAHDLGAAAQALERLGFTVAPASWHRERPAPGVPLAQTGTANRCLMFRRGYVEVLGIVDRQRYSGWITGALSRYQGLHVIGFGCEALERLLAGCEASGRKLLVRKLTRAVEIAGEERFASFTILFHADTEFPEGRFVTMQHHTRDVLWHPSLLEHPNGARSLSGVTLAVADPHEFAGRVAAWTRAEEMETGEQAVRVDLPGGFIEAMTPRQARAVYGPALADPLPPIIGMTIAVADLTATARWLRQQQASYRDGGEGILVPASACCGSFIHFVREV